MDFIPQQNKELEKKLNDEILKNKKLEEENRQLKEKLNIINQNYTNEIEKLKSDLLKANKIISSFQNNQLINNNDSNENKKLKEENMNLKYQLILKENEIKDLQNKIQNNIIINQPKYNMNEIIVITFISTDSSVVEGIKCLPSDVFAEVEEKLYKKYDELRNTNNMFTVNAKPVLRFKKISENNIKDGDKIQLFKLE